MIRVIPFLNDFVPFPENIHQEEKKILLSLFTRSAPETPSFSFKAFVKRCFFLICILGLFYVVDQWKVSLIEIVILFHLALFVLQIRTIITFGNKNLRPMNTPLKKQVPHKLKNSFAYL
jgi:hypothetical protein